MSLLSPPDIKEAVAGSKILLETVSGSGAPDLPIAEGLSEIADNSSPVSTLANFLTASNEQASLPPPPRELAL